MAGPNGPAQAVTPDGGTVIVGDDSGGLVFLAADTLAVVRRVPAHSVCVNDLAVSPDGRTLASVCSADPVVKLFDLPAGTAARTVEVGECGPTTVAFSPSGRRLAVGGTDLVLIDPAAGRVLARAHAAGNSLQSLAFSPDGAFLAGVPPQEDGVWLWEVRPSAEARTVAVGKDPLLAVGPGGSLSVRRDGRFEVRDGHTGSRLGTVPDSGRGITRITIGPAGRVALIDDRGVVLWNLADGTARPGPRLPDSAADRLAVFGWKGSGDRRPWPGPRLGPDGRPAEAASRG